jgi:hypothetical protein
LSGQTGANDTFSDISATVVGDGRVQITYKLGIGTDIVTKVLEEGDLTEMVAGLTFELTTPKGRFNRVHLEFHLADRGGC